MGFGYRAKYIVNSLELITKKGQVWLDNLPTCEKPVEELLLLTGVGRKVADCIMLFSLKKHFVVPLDIHMVKFFNESIADKNKFKHIETLNKKTYEDVSANYIKVFGDYAGWLHSIFYMSRIDKDGKTGKNSKKKEKFNKDNNIEEQDQNEDEDEKEIESKEDESKNVKKIFEENNRNNITSQVTQTKMNVVKKGGKRKLQDDQYEKDEKIKASKSKKKKKVSTKK
jgi:N-glycosylase/DNA lyase